MKKIISFFLALACGISFCAVKAFAAAPPRKDGVIFSGTTACGKKIALTFDDGPHPVKTPKILEILKKNSVRATFFVVGSLAEYHPEIVKKEAELGHEIANHSYTHPRFSKLKESEIKAEIEKTDAIIKKAAGVTPRLFRPPEGAYSQGIVSIAASLGKETVIWTVDTLDWAKSPTDKIVENVKTNVTAGSIILFHDCTRDGTFTTEALEVLIPHLKAQGYEFVTVSELIEGSR
jgi:polysaccharide deacetylase family sporulation protein PdaB